MPMNFPDMKSLIEAAEVHKFRKPHEDEAEERYRVALADHVQKIDFVESMEIRTSKGWDQWTPKEGVEMLVRSGLGDLLKEIAGRGTPTATVLADDAEADEL
jgi:hypothetical protein